MKKKKLNMGLVMPNSAIDHIGEDSKQNSTQSTRSTPKVKKGGVPKKKSTQGLAKGWDRQTIIMRPEHLEKLKALAFFDRVFLKETLDNALVEYLGKRKKDLKPALAIFKKLGKK